MLYVYRTNLLIGNLYEGLTEITYSNIKLTRNTLSNEEVEFNKINKIETLCNQVIQLVSADFEIKDNSYTFYFKDGCSSFYIVFNSKVTQGEYIIVSSFKLTNLQQYFEKKL